MIRKLIKKNFLNEAQKNRGWRRGGAGGCGGGAARRGGNEKKRAPLIAERAVEVPSRIELLYTVLQTVASPLGHGTIGGFAGAKLHVFFHPCKFSPTFFRM